jgi:hypothetical protein
MHVWQALRRSSVPLRIRRSSKREGPSEKERDS